MCLWGTGAGELVRRDAGAGGPGGFGRLPADLIGVGGRGALRVPWKEGVPCHPLKKNNSESH